MLASTVRLAAEPLLYNLRQIINNHLLNDGDKESDSQRINLLNRLAALEHAFNGIQDQDCIDPFNLPPQSR